MLVYKPTICNLKLVPLPRTKIFVHSIYNYLNYLNEACYYYHNVFKKLPFLSFIDETIASPIQLEVSKHPTILFLPRKWATRE